MRRMLMKRGKRTFRRGYSKFLLLPWYSNLRSSNNYGVRNELSFPSTFPSHPRRDAMVPGIWRSMCLHPVVANMSTPHPLPHTTGCPTNPLYAVAGNSRLTTPPRVPPMVSPGSQHYAQALDVLVAPPVAHAGKDEQYTRT